MSAPRKPGTARLVIEVDEKTLSLIRDAIASTGDPDLTPEIVAARVLERRLTVADVLEATRGDRLH